LTSVVIDGRARNILLRPSFALWQWLHSARLRISAHGSDLSTVLRQALRNRRQPSAERNCFFLATQDFPFDCAQGRLGLSHSAASGLGLLLLPHLLSLPVGRIPQKQIPLFVRNDKILAQELSPERCGTFCGPSFALRQRLHSATLRISARRLDPSTALRARSA